MGGEGASNSNAVGRHAEGTLVRVPAARKGGWVWVCVGGWVWIGVFRGLCVGWWVWIGVGGISRVWWVERF